MADRDTPAPETPAPLWKRVASGTAVVGVVALCGALGYYAGTAGRGEAPAATAQQAAPPALPTRADFGGTAASADVRALADWVVANRDHGQRSFAIVDKSNPSVYVFGPDGRLAGKAPALVGLAVGDESVPGIGDRPIEKVKPHERTTPAGRFVTAPGQNLTGEEVIWVDYHAAVSMHSVRALVAEERRLERLASPIPAEHRISYGCINLPHEFFKTVAQPAFSQPGGIIYVLPETRPWQTIVAATAR
ncbi:MAG TPA: hypothetical protein VHM00_14350 [Caldimonas sp.]|nr:hypothetical protein [Caldimonas sp.]HEX2542250.1 hypothetical protein [Caldimonas sp.]